MKKEVLEVEVKTGQSEANIKDVVDAIKDLNQNIVSGNKKTEDSLGGVEDAAKKSASGISKLGKTIKTIASAGGVIFLLSKAFEIFKEVAGQNQKVVDFFAITMETLSLAFNDLFKFIENNVGGVVSAFKAIFNDPLQAVKDLGNAIKDNITERFNSALEVLGLLGSAAKKFFSGDFGGALEDAKLAGKEYIDVMTGVDDSFNKIGDSISNAVNATSNYIKETVGAAQSIIALNKASEMASVTLQGLIEKYDREAELLRQIRDDSSRSISERIKANEDLNVVLENQQKAMQQQAQLIVDAAQAQFNKNASDENALALQEALNEQSAISAQITGFKSEQQTNLNSLLQEQKDIQNELALIGKNELETGKIEAEQKLQTQIDLITREVENEQERNALLLEAQRVYQEEVSTLQEEFDAKEIADAEANAAKQKEIKDAALAETQAIADAEASIRNANLNNVAQGFALLSQLAGKNRTLQAIALLGESAAGIAKIIINTKAANAAAVLKYALLPGGALLAKAESTANNISAGIGIAATSAATAKGLSALKAGGSAPSASIGSEGGSTRREAAATSFNIVGQGGTNQLAESIGSQQKQPIKAYVVSGDVSSAQSMERNIIESASI